MKGVAVGLLALLIIPNPTLARDLGQWEGTDPAISRWYRSLMQPDNPSVSCCGEADSYFCDETYENGRVVCIIADDRDNKVLRRKSIANGTRIEIPDHKLKFDQGNPVGRGVVFLSSNQFVWCYVRSGGV
jgi:hypothetical protein